MSAAQDLFTPRFNANAPRFNRVGLALLVASLAIGGVATAAISHPAPLIAGALVGLYLVAAVKIADQWEKAIVLRLGRYRGLRGPGPFRDHPDRRLGEHFVDQRVRVTDVRAETALTRDTVPVNVDAIVFWVGVERGEGDPGGRRLHERHHPERADRAARVDRPPRAGADDHRARDARA